MDFKELYYEKALGMKFKRICNEKASGNYFTNHIRSDENRMIDKDEKKEVENEYKRKSGKIPYSPFFETEEEAMKAIDKMIEALKNWRV